MFITIRASYVKICNGNVTAAALISFFENWHNYKLQVIREWKKEGSHGSAPNTWQHHTGKDLEKGIFGLGRRHSIDQAKQQLSSMGVITIGRNPNYKFAFDATLHYQFQPDIVNNLLAFAENSTPGQDVEIDLPEYAETDTPEDAENSAAIPEDSTSNQQTSQSAAPTDAAGSGAPGTKPDAGKKKKKKPAGAPKDLDWQRWVDRWDRHYKDRHDGMAPMINDVQLGPQGLKGIRKHLVTVCVKQEGKSDDDCGFLAWDYILTHWDDMRDQFLCGQFDLTVILKKINDILNRLKNGGRTTTGQAGGRGAGTSHDRNTAVANY